MGVHPKETWRFDLHDLTRLQRFIQGRGLRFRLRAQLVLQLALVCFIVRLNVLALPGGGVGQHDLPMYGFVVWIQQQRTPVERQRSCIIPLIVAMICQVMKRPAYKAIQLAAHVHQPLLELRAAVQRETFQERSTIERDGLLHVVCPHGRGSRRLEQVTQAHYIHERRHWQGRTAPSPA